MNTITELEKEIEALEENKKDIDDKIVSIKKKIVVLMKILLTELKKFR